jgi:D-sedoheptulose 7-phosphate isomerase
MSDATAQRSAHRHLADLTAALDAFAADVPRLEEWGEDFARALFAGGRLLVAGNGGSAAHAQHLSSELVGRYETERRPLSAIALSAESSSVTAIVNDYGADHVFSRQVLAHGRRGDVFVAFSTSGRSANILSAVHVARREGLGTYALTGKAPNPLASLCAERAIAIPASRTATVQEVHQVAIHLLCAFVDAATPVPSTVELVS